MAIQYGLIPFSFASRLFTAPSYYRSITVQLPKLIGRNTLCLQPSQRHLVMVTRLKTNYFQRFATTWQTTAKNFEQMSSKVTCDITVFTYENGRFFLMMTSFGVVQYFFWANLASICYSGFGGLKPVDGGEAALGSGTGSKNGFWANVVEAQHRYKNKLAVACMVIGMLTI